MVQILVLALLFVLHWSIIIGLTTYVFWFPTLQKKSTRSIKNADYAYLIFFTLMIISWCIFGACPISTIEKHILYVSPESIPGFVNPSLQLYQGTNTASFLAMSFINCMYFYNLIIVFNRLKFPPAIAMIYLLVLGVMMGTSRIYEYQSLN